MASTGDLRVVVTSDSGQFRSDMTANAGAIRRFKSEVNGTAGGSGANRMLEFGRLAEDFSVGYQLQGMTGALRASANNITQLAAMVSPLAGGLAGLGVAAVGLVPILMNLGTTVEDDAKKVDKLASSFGNAAQQLEQFSKIRSNDLAAIRDRNKIPGSGSGDLLDMRSALSEDKKAKGSELSNLANDLSGIIGVNRLTVANEALRTASIGLLNPHSITEDLKTTVFKNSRGLPESPLTEEQLGMAFGVLQKMQVAGREVLAFGETQKQIDAEMQNATRREAAQGALTLQKAAAERRNALFAEQERMKNETLTPAEKLGRAFDSVSALRLGAEREGVALDSKITGRFQLGALKDFAKASGLLTEAGKLTGATRGSSDDFSARIGANTRDPATLLERQLNQMQKDGAKQDELVGLMKKLVEQAKEQPVVMEF